MHNDQVGATRFERATSWSQTRRSSQAELRPDGVFFGKIRPRQSFHDVRRLAIQELLVKRTNLISPFCPETWLNPATRASRGLRTKCRSLRFNLPLANQDRVCGQAVRKKTQRLAVKPFPPTTPPILSRSAPTNPANLGEKPLPNSNRPAERAANVPRSRPTNA